MGHCADSVYDAEYHDVLQVAGGGEGRYKH